jgi:hypothetical protein
MGYNNCLKKEKKRNVEQTKDSSPHIIYILKGLYLFNLFKKIKKLRIVPLYGFEFVFK